MLRAAGVETHLIVSRAAEQTRHLETGIDHRSRKSAADVSYSVNDIGAALASGSFKTKGMLIAPCTIKTMSEVNAGIGANLMSRAADVVLKERRRLVLVLRETSLHLGHLRSMTSLTEMGAVIFPPVPAFYTRPATGPAH
ncbi:UbiX family flavin prenyltransferase [Salinisphaera sp. Q1T1-3]|uniref:UbiX family flavin prenyltransferase n=1 Tax=Salinisphaera sp. Q1T1-3 TaxID=2321229 RepID=UPI0018F375BB|nr:UbiX family flavin prenyltransferase [Salinisphaera sp. Q1T1-3]